MELDTIIETDIEVLHMLFKVSENEYGRPAEAVKACFHLAVRIRNNLNELFKQLEKEEEKESTNETH